MTVPAIAYTTIRRELCTCLLPAYLKNTTYYNYPLIIDAYSKIQKNYGIKEIKTEEGMDKLDMFQSRFGKIDKFGW